MSTKIIETFPAKFEDVKPKERHCSLEFWKGVKTGVSDPVQMFQIEDEAILSDIIKLGYKRKNMQSLYMTKHYSYLTTDTIEGDSKIQGVYEKAELYVKGMLNKNGISTPKDYDEITFSFPEEMINDDGSILTK